MIALCVSLLCIPTGSAAPPPECGPTSLVKADVLHRLRAFEPFAALASWKVRDATIDTCDGSEKLERLELELSAPLTLSPGGLAYHAPLLVWIDARTGEPEGGAEDRGRVAALAAGLPKVAKIVERDAVVASWLSTHRAPDASFEPATAARAACIVFVGGPQGAGKPARLEWCEDEGLRNVTFERWDAISAPWLGGLRAAVERRAKGTRLVRASLDRWTGPWRAQVELGAGGAAVSAFEVTLLLGDDGTWTEASP